jgi:hypothetical protein
MTIKNKARLPGIYRFEYSIDGCDEEIYDASGLEELNSKGQTCDEEGNVLGITKSIVYSRKSANGKDERIEVPFKIWRRSGSPLEIAVIIKKVNTGIFGPGF